tara:strand:+ start:3033 stop:3293 length:261 start_codon:yes stop_codon:yes gene_type:complete
VADFEAISARNRLFITYFGYKYLAATGIFGAVWVCLLKKLTKFHLQLEIKKATPKRVLLFRNSSFIRVSNYSNAPSFAWSDHPGFW